MSRCQCSQRSITRVCKENAEYFRRIEFFVDFFHAYAALVRGFMNRMQMRPFRVPNTSKANKNYFDLMIPYFLIPIIH